MLMLVYSQIAESRLMALREMPIVCFSVCLSDSSEKQPTRVSLGMAVSPPRHGSFIKQLEWYGFGMFSTEAYTAATAIWKSIFHSSRIFVASRCFIPPFIDCLVLRCGTPSKSCLLTFLLSSVNYWQFSSNPDISRRVLQESQSASFTAGTFKSDHPRCSIASKSRLATYTVD